MKRKNKVSPYIVIISSFLFVIIIGTVLLKLPIATSGGDSLTFVEAFFTTVSSVCVTGLTVISNVGSTLSVFGKIIVAILIEIGGLSFITLTIFFFLTFKVKLGISESYLMKEQLNQGSIKDLEKLIVKIVKITLSIQFIGAIINTLIIYFSNDIEYSFIDSLGIGVFHTISAFNNAGFDIFGTSSSMLAYSGNILLNIVTMILIVIGGIGFVVIIDIYENKRFKRLSLHSKITLVMTTILIVFGAIAIKCSMWDDMTLLQAIFLSVSSRTAGFSTYDMSTISNAAYVVVVFLMFIGASSGGTGGGVKTSTLFILCNFIYSYSFGKSPKAFYRSISNKLLLKALALINIAILFNVIMTFVIALIEPDLSLKAILFEQVSAFSTTGLSMGITTELSSASKILLCVSMFVGRVGPLTFMGIMNKHWLTEPKEKRKYVEENVMIG